MVTKEDCIRGGLFRYLQSTYKSRGRTNEPIQVRSSGKCQTWKTRPNDFKLPVKYGMYESSYITQDNAALFITEDEYQKRSTQADAVASVLKNNPTRCGMNGHVKAPLDPYCIHCGIPMSENQPTTGARCGCKPGIQRDNCANCEGTGWVIDFAKIRNRQRGPSPATKFEENPLSIKPAGSNQTILTLDDDTEIFFSYKTPVAAHIPGQGYFRTDKQWSRTTSKHINKYLDGMKPTIKPQAWFDTLASGMRNNPKHGGVIHTLCRHCNQEIEGIAPYRKGEWRDRGNNTSCPWPARGKTHAPVPKTRDTTVQHGVVPSHMTNKQYDEWLNGPQIVKGYRVGQRVELHPGTDAWMRGDRYGDIVKIGRRTVYVKMDKSGKILSLMPHNVTLVNPKGKSMSKRRTIRIARPAHAKRYGAGHPYFSKLPIHVQERNGVAWKTVAAFVGTPEGIRRAKQYAGIWKRERGKLPVRVIDIR